MVQPTSPQDFKKKKGFGEVITLPSGFAIKCKRVSLMDFMKQGNIPNALMALVNEAISKGEDLKPEELLQSDDEKIDMDTIRDMYEMIDTIVCSIAMEPTILPTPAVEADRREDQLYSDELEDADKLHMFQWSSGKVEGVKPFREEPEQPLDSLEKEPVGTVPAKLADGYGPE